MSAGSTIRIARQRDSLGEACIAMVVPHGLTPQEGTPSLPRAPAEGIVTASAAKTRRGLVGAQRR